MREPAGTVATRAEGAGTHMVKLIQICASENDLFGLDGDGVVYQYNFKTNSWVKLGHGRYEGGESPPAEGQTASAPPSSRNARPPARS